jgi:hypothetical protein
MSAASSGLGQKFFFRLHNGPRYQFKRGIPAVAYGWQRDSSYAHRTACLMRV